MSNELSVTNLTITCETCVMRRTDHCHDCVVTFMCETDATPAEAVDLLVGQVDVVVDDEDAGHGSTSGPGRAPRCPQDTLGHHPTRTGLTPPAPP